jgi:hypothetical protein
MIKFGLVGHEATPMSTAVDQQSEEMSAGREQAGKLRLWQKALLIAGLLWALLVIVPDFYRLYAPLASLGFSADNSGIIYAVSGKPASVVDVPGEPHRGLKIGDAIQLETAPCWKPNSALIWTDGGVC